VVGVAFGADAVALDGAAEDAVGVGAGPVGMPKDGVAGESKDGSTATPVANGVPEGPAVCGRAAPTTTRTRNAAASAAKTSRLDGEREGTTDSCGRVAADGRVHGKIRDVRGQVDRHTT
jgi:hypothetical protein